MSDYTPKPEHKFTFGLWTVGNIGRDPFGGPVREQKLLTEINANEGSMDQYFGKYSSEKANSLKAQSFDRSAIAGRGLRYERLDQLTIEILLGVR